MSNQDQLEIENTIAELHATVRSLKGIVPYVWILICGAFALGGWVATLEFRTQVQSGFISEHDSSLKHLELWRAETSANRFTSGDAAKLMTALTEVQVAQDKRIQRVEDSMARINVVLDKIEDKLSQN